MEPLHILIFGAHPDDCDFSAGGTAIRYARMGHRVRFVSMTMGDAGHYLIGGVELARRRYAETQASAKIAGVVYQVMDNHDGELEPTLDNRRLVIGQIREFGADLVLAHRADEYHPDHRAVGVLVQDASYLVGVPNILPLVPHTQHPPVICQFAGGRKIKPEDKDVVVVDIDEAMDDKVNMLNCHESQVYEWMPYNRNDEAAVPQGAEERLKWLRATLDERYEADRLRAQLVARYGEEKGNKVKHAEALIPCQYGAPLTDEARKRLFPF